MKRIDSRKFLCAAAFGIAGLLAGCVGYQFGSVPPAQMEGVKRIAVPTFRNDTLEPRLSGLVTNSVIKKVQMDGTYQVVSLSENPDVILRGRITEIGRSQFRSVRTDVVTTSEIEMELFVEFDVEDPLVGMSRMRGVARGKSHVPIEGNTQRSERQLLADAAERLSWDLVSRISDGWSSERLSLVGGEQ
jgi:hypothetical protein